MQQSLTFWIYIVQATLHIYFFAITQLNGFQNDVRCLLAEAFLTFKFLIL